MTEYKYTEKCDLTGMGGGYETATKDMVIAGMKWWDEFYYMFLHSVFYAELKNSRGYDCSPANCS